MRHMFLHGVCVLQIPIARIKMTSCVAWPINLDGVMLICVDHPQEQVFQLIKEEYMVGLILTAQQKDQSEDGESA